MVARVGILYCLAVLTGLGLAQSPGNATTDCKEDKDCTDLSTAVCISGKCGCPEDSHTLVLDECLPISTEFGSSCKKGPQCTSKWGDLATCKNGICSCQNGSMFDEDACYLMITLVGDFCDSERKQLCYLINDGDNQHVECYAGTCQCKTGYVATEDNRECRQSCKEDKDCTDLSTAVCSSGKCGCPELTHLLVLGECLPISTEFGSSCKKGPQCTTKWGDLATCTNGKCACQNGAIFDKDACYLKIPLVGEFCTSYSKQLCYLEDDGDNQHVECDGQRCRCKYGYTTTDGNRKCLEISTKFGSSCTAGPQCTNKWGDLATCANGKCSCQNGSIFIEDACYYKISLVGEPCDNYSKQLCYLEDDGDNQHVECYGGECQCKSGYMATEDNRECRDSGDAGVMHLISISCLVFVVLAKIVV